MTMQRFDWDRAILLLAMIFGIGLGLGLSIHRKVWTVKRNLSSYCCSSGQTS
jgi:hypothetical protein